MRRKGELSPAERDRRWPHQVAVAQVTDARAQYDRNIEIDRWRVAAGDQAAPRGYSIVHENVWWEVHCFESAELAVAFMKQFGGQLFDPKAKSRGRGWQWKGDFKGG